MTELDQAIALARETAFQKAEIDFQLRVLQATVAAPLFGRLAYEVLSGIKARRQAAIARGDKPESVVDLSEALRLSKHASKLLLQEYGLLPPDNPAPISNIKTP